MNSLPIRVLVAGGTTTDRDEVEQAIQLDRGFSIVPLQPAEASGNVGADAVVLIQQTASDTETGEPTMLPIPLAGAPAIVIACDEAGDGRLPGLERLPQALRRAVSDSQQVSPEKVVSEDLEASKDTEMAKRAMRESQRLAAIGKLTAEIAHEINNPLESVGNLVYLAIREAGMPARAVEYLRTAERELARIVQISKQTLSFSRESADAVAVCVTELMDEVVGLYSRRIGQKKLTVVREYAATESIPALPGELRQVFSNLVANAIEATSTGGMLRLRIRTTAQHVGAMTRPGLRISVGDTGAGIPEAARHRLGQMFFTTKGESGTGLGLWVTKSVITRYGGTLQVRSSTGSNHGTVFSLFLPFPDAVHSPEEGPGERVGHGNVTEISRHPRYASPSPRSGEPSSSAYRKRNG